MKIWIITLSLLLLASCTPGALHEFAENLQKEYDTIQDKSFTRVTINMFGEETKSEYIMFTKDGKFLLETAGKVRAYDGVNDYTYNKESGILGMAESMQKGWTPENPDFYAYLLHLFETSNVKVKYLDDQARPEYIITVDYDNQPGIDIFYVYEDNYEISKIEHHLDTSKCDKVKQFFSENFGLTKEDCIIGSVEYRDIVTNQNPDNNIFNLKSAYPEATIVNSREALGTYGSCERNHKRLEDAPFRVLLPSELPERFSIVLPPEELPEVERDPCPISAALNRYSSFYTSELNIHERIRYDKAEIQFRSSYEKNGKTHTSTGSAGSIYQSESPWLHYFWLTSPYANIVKTVDINGQEASIISNENDNRIIAILWENNDVYFLAELALPEQTTAVDVYTGESIIEEIDPLSVFSEEEYLGMLRSLS